jgi:hypothetical protein
LDWRALAQNRSAPLHGSRVCNREYAELELEAWRVRRVDQHAFQRRHGRLIIADLRREGRIFEGEIEIVGAGKHLLEQRLAARFDIGWSEPLHRNGRVPGNSGRGPAHGETGNRDGDRPLGPPQHHVTARPFREGACRLIPAYPPRPRKT